MKNGFSLVFIMTFLLGFGLFACSWHIHKFFDNNEVSGGYTPNPSCQLNKMNLPNSAAGNHFIKTVVRGDGKFGYVITGAGSSVTEFPYIYRLSSTNKNETQAVYNYGGTKISGGGNGKGIRQITLSSDGSQGFIATSDITSDSIYAYNLSTINTPTLVNDPSQTSGFPSAPLAKINTLYAGLDGKTGFYLEKDKASSHVTVYQMTPSNLKNTAIVLPTQGNDAIDFDLGTVSRDGHIGMYFRNTSSNTNSQSYKLYITVDGAISNTLTSSNLANMLNTSDAPLGACHR